MPRHKGPALHAVLLKGALPSPSPSPSLPRRHTHATHPLPPAILTSTDLSVSFFEHPQAPARDAVLQQPADEPRHARRHGHGHGRESRYAGPEPDAGHEWYGHAGDGQLWAGLEEPGRLAGGRAACAGADGSGRAMTIPRRVLRTSPTPPGEPGTLYVSRFLFRPGWQLIHPPRPTPSTTVAASNEGSSITLCVSAVNMNLSSPSTVTHKTNVHSPTRPPNETWSPQKRSNRSQP